MTCMTTTMGQPTRGRCKQGRQRVCLHSQPRPALVFQCTCATTRPANVEFIPVGESGSPVVELRYLGVRVIAARAWATVVKDYARTRFPNKAHPQGKKREVMGSIQH